MNRLIEIVTMDLNLERIKLEEELERVVNDTVTSTGIKTNMIKDILSRMVNLNQMILTWVSYTTTQTESEHNNNNK